MWANAQRDGRPADHRWRPLALNPYTPSPLNTAHAQMEC